MEKDDKNINEQNSKFDIESNEFVTNIDIDKINSEENVKSQETKKSNKKEKKIRTIKQIIISRIIFVIVFLAVISGITYYFIYRETDKKVLDNNEENFSNIEENSKNSAETENSENSNYAVVDLDGVYYTNPIEISEKTESMDRVTDGFKYYEIDGLKDEKIEKKINAYIKDDFENYLKNLMSKTNKKTTYLVSLSVVGNFANIISLKMNINEYVDDKLNEYYHFCNLNLVDGEEIDLGTDVFNSTSVASHFLLETLYDKMMKYNIEEKNDGIYPNESSQYLEEDIYEIVSNYQRGKGFEFGISPSAILYGAEVYQHENSMYYDNSSQKILYLNFLNYSENLIIYDRFSSSKELYDGKYEKVRTFL